MPFRPYQLFVEPVLALVLRRLRLAALGVDEQKVAEIEKAYRTKDKARLRVQLEKGLFSDEARAMTFRPETVIEPREP